MHKINLTDQQVQTIGAALGRMPYEQVASVIADLQAQINASVEAASAAAADAGAA